MLPTAMLKALDISNYSGVPAPTNLPVPPHKYVTATKIIIGDSGKAA